MKKKVVSVMLCAAMTAAVLAGCGSSSAETVSEDTSAAAEETEDAAAEETAETAEADTEESAGGTLVMGTNAEFPPYEYYEGQEVVGIDAEMAAAVAEKLGMELKIEDMAFDSLIPALSSGKVDIVAAGMTVTEDRLASVNFSDTYATGIQAIIVTEDSDIASADDLVGKTIGVQQGTTGDLYATDVEGATIERYAKGMEAVQSLSQGKIDAVIIDNEPAKAYVEANQGLKILDTEYTVEDYAAAVKKGNTELLDKVNKAMEELKADGTLDEIIANYIHE